MDNPQPPQPPAFLRRLGTDEFIPPPLNEAERRAVRSVIASARRMQGERARRWAITGQDAGEPQPAFARSPEIAGEVTWRRFPGVWGIETLSIRFTLG